MTHIGLFEGVGAFSLAAKWMGWRTIAWCEINKFCQQVLEYHFSEAKKHEDVTKTDFSIYRGLCDVLTAGFPCQPFSTSGEQRGEDDERYLVEAMLTAFRAIGPGWFVGENVYGITARKFSKVFEYICAQVEAEGYEIQPYIIPACAVDAPHKRERIFFIAHSKRGGPQGPGKPGDAIGSKTERNRETNWPKHLFQGKSLPHLFEHDNGIPKRLVNQTISEYREQANRSMGNSLVPAIALQLFKTIEQYEQLKVA